MGQLSEKLAYYNQIKGSDGNRLATFYRFQNKPSSDSPRIYLPYDSLLNHTSRLCRETKLWLGDILSGADILETQLILVGHDVDELIKGDVSRLAGEDKAEEVGTEQIRLPDDEIRFGNFVVAQNFLENGGTEIPGTPLAIIARVLDTIDGNYFAFALLENYAIRVGGENPDTKLQTLLDRSYAYVNKMRLKYRTKVATVADHYRIDLASILERLLQKESENISRFSAVIRDQGYRVSNLI